MRQHDIRVIAVSLGLTPGRTTKVDLFRRIQTSEGNFPCIATAKELYCDQPTCIWRDDCFSTVKKSQVT